MTTITVNKQGTIQLPQEVLRALGWQLGSQLELSVERDTVTITANSHQVAKHNSSVVEKSINDAFGMIKVHHKKNKGGLLDFDVSKYATLFDEA